MLKNALIVLAFILISSAVHAKMTSPFSGSLAPEKTDASVGGTVTLTLTIATDTAFKAAEAKLELPKGLVLLDGKKVAKLNDLKPGEKINIIYRLRVKEKGEQKIIVGVTATGLSPGLGLGRTFVSFINPAPVKDNAIHTTDSQGTKVIVK